MTDFEREAIAGYVEKIGREWRSGQATEHTYRPMLKELFEALLPRVLVINEPKHIECGAPDYLIRRGTDTLGFIEAKGDRIALADEAAFERFVQLVARFAEARPREANEANFIKRG